MALSPEDWRGRHSFPGGEIIFPDPTRARELITAAEHAAKTDLDPVNTIELLEESIRLDYINAANDGENLARRIEAYATLGREEPYRSVLLYEIGLTLSRLQLWREAAVAYHAAANLDPLFAWHLNNLAWMAATATDPRAHAGPFAVTPAKMACAISGWGCWCFLGTLAAAFARDGDFRRAVAWQRISLQMTPQSNRPDEAARLSEFEADRAYTEREHKPVFGDQVSDEELAQIDVPELLHRAAALIDAPRTPIH